jgi:hypothetical protein
MKMTDQEHSERVEVARRENVPICGSAPLQIPRSLWNEAWIAYAKKYHPGASQYIRLLNEGFYASELDDLRPGWRPVAQEIERLRADLLAIRSCEVFYAGPHTK